MKSKIDEVILLLSDLSNCITIIAEEQANYLGISQVIVDKLEQLRPYVELGEIEIVYADGYEGEDYFDKRAELIQQIKESNNV